MFEVELNVKLTSRDFKRLLSMPLNISCEVVHRHDRASMAVSFMSHVFARLSGPQVALLDAYQGAAGGVVEIQKEKMSFNSVMALEAATYEARITYSMTYSMTYMQYAICIYDVYVYVCMYVYDVYGFKP